MKRLLKIFDYIFVLRPTLFFLVWPVFLAGFFVQSKFGVTAPVSNDIQSSYSLMMQGDSQSLWVGGVLTLLMGAVFALNQIMDRESDHKNNKLTLIAQGYLSPRTALIEAAVVGVLGLAAGFIVSWKIGTVFLVLFAIAGLLYSFSPFKLKNRPIPGLFTHIVAGFLIFCVGWITRGEMHSALFIYAIPYATFVAAMYLFTTTLDAEGDAATDKTTFAVKFGTRVTVFVGLGFELVALLTALLLRDEIIFYPALFSLPFYVWAAFYPALPEIIRTIKYSVLLLAFTVCVKWIITYSNYFFFLILLGVYVGSKIYYRLRFGVNYPNLSA